MNILYLVHQFYPVWRTGTERFVLHVASMMQKWGHRVHVATYDMDLHQKGGQVVGECRIRNYMYEGLPVTAFRPTRLRPGTIPDEPGREARQAAIQIIANGDYDLVHVAHPWRMGELISAATRMGLPYVLTLTDGWLCCPTFLINTQGDLCAGPRHGEQCRQDCPKWGSSFIQQRLHHATRLLHDARQLISPSEFQAAVFQQEWPGLRIKVIPHGMDYRYLQRHIVKKRSDAPLSLLYVGTLLPHKGLHVLLHALRQMHSTHWVLDVYGPRPNPSYWRSVRQIAANDPRIRFHGTFEEQRITGILRGADAIVIPSVYLESYCMVLHEALACGVPAIVSDAGHLAQAVKDGVHGFQFKTGDTASLINVLDRIASKRNVLNRVRRNLETWFPPTIEQEAYAYLREYSRVIHGD